MSLTLKSIPGFADLSDDVLDAGRPALGVNLSKISQNAAFGMTRIEFFYGRYKNGDTIPTPTSPIDGYNYARNELMYIWQPVNTANPDSGWLTGPGPLWYANWFVDQSTAEVFSEEWYGSGGQTGKSNDGIIAVFTVAQRQLNNLFISTPPVYSDIANANFYTDAPLKTSILKQLNQNAKAACVDTEFIYMGEFVNGQTVGIPVSPIDGYQYSRAELIYAKSWKWTTVGTSYTQPAPRDTYTWINRLVSTIDQNGLIAVSVQYMQHEDNAIDTTNGRIAVWAVCQRSGANVTVLGTTVPWNFSGGVNGAYAFTFSNDTGTVSTPVVAGNKVSIVQTAGLLSEGIGQPFKNGDGRNGTAADGSDPGQYITVPPCPGCAIGAWVDGTGQLVALPFLIGSGVTVTAPASTVALQIGVNAHGDRSTAKGSWTFHVSQQADPSSNTLDSSSRFVVGDAVGRNEGIRTIFNRNFQPAPGAPGRNPEAAALAVVPTYPPFSSKFTELDSALFGTGQPLPASLYEQINANAREASNTPEIFSGSYINGQYVPLPVSSVDGYQYTRDELFYIWSWRMSDTLGYPGGQGTNTARNGDTIRIAVLIGFVDSTGLVSGTKYVVPDGGSATIITNGIHNSPTLDVLTIAARKSQRASAFNPIANVASASVGNNPAPDNDLGGFTVNGS